jgi:hypothetical protein
LPSFQRWRAEKRPRRSVGGGDQIREALSDQTAARSLSSSLRARKHAGMRRLQKKAQEESADLLDLMELARDGRRGEPDGDLQRADGDGREVEVSGIPGKNQGRDKHLEIEKILEE